MPPIQRPSIAKRNREIAKKEKAKAKAERRAQRAHEGDRRSTADGEDPDLAGIVPGPILAATDLL